MVRREWIIKRIVLFQKRFAVSLQKPPQHTQCTALLSECKKLLISTVSLASRFAKKSIESRESLYGYCIPIKIDSIHVS